MSEHPTPFLDAAPWRERLFDGDWIAAEGGILDITEPATGRLLHRTGLANAADVDRACNKAAQAQLAWAGWTARRRAALFLAAADQLERHRAELAPLIARETGGILPKAELELREAGVILQQVAGQLLQPHGVVLPSETGALSYARRLPHGVVGVISPFNFPLILSLRAVAPALACGNAVVLKPDHQTPVSGGVLIARLFEAVGLPRGVLQLVPGQAEAGAALCAHPWVRMIAFTGSTQTGRQVAETAGRHLKKVALELGGKNPLIVLDDADLDRAVGCAAWGSFLHQGQICMATGLILVQQEIAAAFIERLAIRAAGLRLGDPLSPTTQLGPLINARQLQRVTAIVADSLAAGARLEQGGSHEGLFYAPTVLSGVRPGMRAFDEEIFGPVASVVTFADEAEAIALANRTPYGLTAGVLSGSLARARALGERLNCGMLHLNDQTVNDEVVNPFGGRGQSGNGGSVGGLCNWDDYSQWQWVTEHQEPPRYPF